MQAEQHRLNSGPERMRRYRERKRQGVVCVAPVPIYDVDIDALVAHQRLAPEDKGDTGKIAEAIEYLVDDWTKGNLARKSDA